MQGGGDVPQIASSSMQLLYLLIALAYLIPLAATCLQTCRMSYYMNQHKKGINCEGLMPLQHLLVMLVPLMRFVQNLIRFATHDAPTFGALVAAAILGLIAFVAVIWAFSMVVTMWAALYHFSMDKTSSSMFKKFKIPLYAVNVICMAVAVVVTIGLLVMEPDAAGDLVTFGEAVISIFAMALCTGALVFGTKLTKMMNLAGARMHNGGLKRASSAASSSKSDLNVLVKQESSVAAEPPVKKAPTSLATKIWRTAVCFGVCFFLEATCVLVSAISKEFFYENAIALTATLHAADIGGLLFILYLFAGGIDKIKKEVEGGKRRGSSTGARSSRRLTSTGSQKNLAPKKASRNSAAGSSVEMHTSKSSKAEKESTAEPLSRMETTDTTSRIEGGEQGAEEAAEAGPQNV